MPGKIKVKVLAGRNLPVMDRAGDTTDAFVEIKFGGVTHKTDVCRKSLNPHWSSTEWYRFEVDESELQDEPLQLRLMDHDTYSANDAIGKVVISLAPLLAKEANNIRGAGQPAGSIMSGWIPVFDTMHGIRGELNIIVKVELFTDFNKYKNSSCDVQFFHCSIIPPGYRATAIHGFVEELAINDDPEYQWIDKIRTPRASNEARQVAFIKLSNQVQRLVGMKAAELGANAVVGYQQNFDLEGEAGVVARAIGTAVSIAPLPGVNQPINLPTCTQQQLRQYLDILATDADSITDLNEYFKHHQDELKKLLNIMNPTTSLDEPENGDDDELDFHSIQQSSDKMYHGDFSIYQDEYASQQSLKHISEDQTDLNKLLKGDANDTDSDSSGPIHKIKKLKTNFFSKRFGSTRTRKSDKQDDQVSIRSNSSDASRLSLNDIKNEFQKFKRVKKPKFRKTFANKEDEGVGMASILARSVIHAHTSLACIAETQDSEQSPSSTMRRTSESEPTVNLSEEEHGEIRIGKTKMEIKSSRHSFLKRIPEIHTSLKNFNSCVDSIPRRKLSISCPTSPIPQRSVNRLTLPEEAGLSGSLTVSGESSVFSSSDEDDESSDQKTDTEKSIQTASCVVRSVLKSGLNLDSIVPGKINKNLTSDFKEVDPKQLPGKASQAQATISNFKQINQVKENSEKIESNLQISDTSSDGHPDENNDATHNSENISSKYVDTKTRFKIHNPFIHRRVTKCLSAPSSPTENTGFVYRSSRKIKRQFSKISKSSIITNISNYSLIPKKKGKERKNTISQHASSTEAISRNLSETVLGSAFLSYADLQSIDKDNNLAQDQIDQREYGSNVKMYIGSEPASRASISGPPSSSGYSRDDEHFYVLLPLKKDKSELKPTGLIHTAMETILIDKVHSLLIPTSPEPNPETELKDKQFFEDVHKKLELVEITRKKNREEQPKQFFNDEHERKALRLENKMNCQKPQHKKDSLVHTAIKTMLIDKVQAIMPLTPIGHPSTEYNVFDDFPKICGTSQHKIKLETGSVTSKQSEPESLIQTAMKTILIDKVQSLVPTQLQVNKDSEEILSQSSENSTSEQVADHGFLHSAMETILLEKIGSLIPTTLDLADLQAVEKEDEQKEVIVVKSCTEDKETNDNYNQSLFTSAVETILLDKVSSLIPGADPLIAHASHQQKQFSPIVAKSNSGLHLDDENHLHLRSAIETILLDKVNIIAPTISGASKLHTETLVIDEPLESLGNKVTCKQNVQGQDNILKKDSQLFFHSDDKQIETAASPNISQDFGTNMIISLSKKNPVLLHFHPILSGGSAPLETILSLPDTSFERSESLDVDGVERQCDCLSECKCQECGQKNNCAGMCDNSHAACRFDRSELEKDLIFEREKEMESPHHSRHESYGGREPMPPTLQQVHTGSWNSTSTPFGICRRSSDSDLNVTPKGGSLNTSNSNAGSGGALFRPSINRNTLEMLEYPFLTMTEYPPGFIMHLGSTVCARSVKLLEGGGDSMTRDAWWAELRTELRSHARALRCNAVIAYSEGCAIWEDVCVLSALGTAALINLNHEFSVDGDTTVNSDSDDDTPESEPAESTGKGSKTTLDDNEIESCLLAHVPYSTAEGSQSAELSNCGGCRKARVPAVLLATCAKPSKLPAYSRAFTLTAVAARLRRAPPTSEPGARDISDQLPFLEYELHKLLIAKLKMQGANALFSLQTQLAIGERHVMALASGTAVRLLHLPPPTPPLVKISENDRDSLDIQKALWDAFTANKVTNGFDIDITLPEPPVTSATDPEPEELPVLDLCSDKETFVLELDEAEEVESAKSLAIQRTHMQAYTSDLKLAPNSPPQAFSQVWRSRLTVTGSGGGASIAAERHVARAMDGVAYKLRRLQPYAITPRLHIELPEDEIQLVVSGTAIPLLDPNKLDYVTTSERSHETSNESRTNSAHSHKSQSSCTSSQTQSQSRSNESRSVESDSSNSGSSRSAGGGGDIHHNHHHHDIHANVTSDDDDIFALDEEQLTHSAGISQPTDTFDHKIIIGTGQPPTTVSLTSLPHVSGARATRRLCALRLLFVRETTAVRELGGLSGFLHTFTCEALAIARAYTASLGGNALTSFYINQLMLQDNAHKNQGQCLLSVGGDVVNVTF